MNKFRVALSGDFCKPDGRPAYPDFDITPLEADPHVEYAYIDADGEISPQHIEDFDGLILLGLKFTRNSIHPNRRLAVVARFGVGYDNVDVEACTQAGIALVITPDAVRRPVAVGILTLMLSLTTKLMIKDTLTRQGPEGFRQKAAHMGVGLVGKTLGSIGVGNIGAEMFRLAKPLDMNFIAYDPYVDISVSRSLGIRMVDLETLFREADILTINCPLTDETRHLVNAERLSLMKPTAYLINTARGPIIDQKALVEVLSQNRIAGAGLDVLEKEPPDAEDPILKLGNVILAPHALSWTDQGFAGIGAADISAVLEVMHGREPVGIVNREVSTHEGWRRKLALYRERFGGERVR
jgi:phosphoglycerate dehydrogenase-like enzyme